MKKLHLLLISILTLIQLNAQVPPHVPTNGLVGWWPFNGNANDVSGNGNNGSVYGATLSFDRNNLNNSCYLFNSSYINIPFSNSINTIQNSITISAWIFMDGGTSLGNPPRVLELRGTSGFVLLSWGNSNLKRSLTGRIYSTNSKPGVLIDHSDSISALQWHSVVFTADGNKGEAKFYLDGNLINITSNLEQISQCNYSNAPLIIGSENNGTMGLWGGKLDDIGIWNRALDSNEIKILYSGCIKSITQQPVNVTTSNKKVKLTCLANDSLQTYQWQYLNNGTWLSLKDSAQFSGTKTSQLTISSLISKNNGQKFRCVVKGNCLNAISNEVTLTYNCVANISAQPLNQGMFVGNATFTCNTDDTLVNYQWQINGGTGWNNLSDAGQYSGTTTNALTVSNVSSSNNNQLFRCIIKGDCLTDTTNEATLRVWGLGVTSVQTMLFKMYPNPSSEVLNISAASNHYTVAVYNSLGQEIYNKAFAQNNNSIEVKQWPAGVYHIELKDQNNSIEIQKMIKN